jgi:hypothetical protein
LADVKLFLSGPMTGKQGFNYEEFAKVTSYLRSLGHEVFSPHETANGETHYARELYMWQALMGLLSCEALVQLPGWEESRGATTEYRVAVETGMDIYSLEEFRHLV